jgi:hypothetical protein
MDFNFCHFEDLFNYYHPANYFFFANDETKMKELNILLKPSVMSFSGGLKPVKIKQRQYLESNQSLNFRDPKKL